jgi:hypothetical protein
MPDPIMARALKLRAGLAPQLDSSLTAAAIAARRALNPAYRDPWELAERERHTLLGAPSRSTPGIGARWWCRSCSGFVSGELAECGKCRDHGPHSFGEDSPLAGNAPRRARLRADQQRRKGKR